MSYQRSTISKGAVDASQLTRQKEARTLFANVKVQSTRFQGGCASRILTESTGQSDYANKLLITEGATFTTPAEEAALISSASCTGSAPTPSGTGYMIFPLTPQSGLVVANDVDLRMGTGDFTIEWYQYMTELTSNPRVFTIGSYVIDGVNIGVSIEGGTFYFWSSGTANFGTDISIDVDGKWAHIAVVRASGTVTAYVNGVSINTTEITDNFNNTADLWIGNQPTEDAPDSPFPGYITNFHWVKGTAKYTEDFTPTNIVPIANTKLLLLATDAASILTDSSANPKTVTQNGTGADLITWGSGVIPFLS
jgi:hypothetical protein